MSQNTLADAASIELESFYDASWSQDRTDDMDVSRWSRYGNDRLYINSGIPKADKYSLYDPPRAGARPVRLRLGR